VVPDAELAAAAGAWAERLARGPSFGLEVTKRMLLREAAMDVETAMAAETEIQAACMQDENFREAYEAFKAKRATVFK
jgi:enoyl-CoA hydratase/carnithine racemase